MPLAIHVSDSPLAQFSEVRQVLHHLLTCGINGSKVVGTHLRIHCFVAEMLFERDHLHNGWTHSDGNSDGRCITLDADDGYTASHHHRQARRDESDLFRPAAPAVFSAGTQSSPGSSDHVSCASRRTDRRRQDRACRAWRAAIPFSMQRSVDCDRSAAASPSTFGRLNWKEYAGRSHLRSATRSPGKTGNYGGHTSQSKTRLAGRSASALLATLQQNFQPWTISVEGLDLWRYDGGPWESAASFPFTRRPWRQYEGTFERGSIVHRMAVRNDHALKGKLEHASQSRNCALLMKAAVPHKQLAISLGQCVGKYDRALSGEPKRCFVLTPSIVESL